PGAAGATSSTCSARPASPARPRACWSGTDRGRPGCPGAPWHSRGGSCGLGMLASVRPVLSELVTGGGPNGHNRPSGTSYLAGSAHDRIRGGRARQQPGRDVPPDLGLPGGGPGGPEELLAAAHAACYAMAFSHSLAQDGTPPQRLHVQATVSLGPKDGGGIQVNASHLEVTGVVPGLDAAAFQAAAEKAEQGCPISNAVRGTLEITVRGPLEERPPR